MKSVIIFVAFFLVSDVFSLDINKLNILTRRKRQTDERWIWGFVDDAVNNTPSTSTPKSKVLLKLIEDVDLKSIDEVNPCDQTPPPTPDFSASGRRIVEQKCEEYLWQVKLRIEENKKIAACKEFKEKHGILDVTKFYYVVGGRPAKEGEYPHMGAIGWKAVAGTWLFKCGGSLISSKFVLTAAHCAQASDKDTEIADILPKIVRFGNNNLKSGINRNITKIITHPQYKPPKKYFDIALMEIEYDLFFANNLQPACLWHDFETKPLGARGTTTGWGVLEPSSRVISPVLQVAEVQIIDSSVCDALLRPNCKPWRAGRQFSRDRDHLEVEICRKNMADPIGDSGGPLQIQIPLPSFEEGPMYYIVGVTSFGFGCAQEDTPGVYTRVQPFLDWIESIVWKQT